ncbi:MAG: hypothetical protein LBI33_07560 [Propionibacteriaceae bacterium]|jgi:Flp pilus assembly protein TadB|nr:hypothetical protein [Propionibacteriaceae bacterium]
MSGIGWVIVAGVLVGAGLWLVIDRFVPAYPNLAQALARLSPLAPPPSPTRPRGWEAIGDWGLAKLPERLRPIPVKDLALLRITPAGFLARKMTYALVGLLFPGVLTTCLRLLGIRLPVLAPALVSLVLAGVGFLLPDLDIRAKAAKARAEFTRTLACYVDLVALERSCGSGTKQALDTAARTGDSWVFVRLREALDRGTWAGVNGWDSLSGLADDLDLSDLADVADIVRLSGTEGAGIYRILRAKSRSLREGLLLTDVTRANETNEKMSLPVSVLGIVFLAILIGPALLSMLGTL